VRTVEHSRRAARGFSLVEVLVAVTVTCVGLVALAGSTTVLMRHGAGAAASIAASARLGTVLDSLRLVPCAALAPGRSSSNGIAVDWTVSASGAARRIGASVTWGLASTRRRLTETAVLCD
jgi:prepilin-type N-terminal cleavage/methylation domain-containing protein